jgi:hypothetical protein
MTKIYELNQVACHMRISLPYNKNTWIYNDIFKFNIVIAMPNLLHEWGRGEIVKGNYLVDILNITQSG